MERKIGEIFEYNGEWYQCVKGESEEKCTGCFFKSSPICIDLNCLGNERKDHTKVIFKKLEKVGEPLKINGKIYQGLISPYGFNNCSMCAFRNISCKDVISCYDDYIFIEIKQNKEDMEEKKLKLREFDLEAAKLGKPVCTRDGRKARIICFDRNWDMHIVALVSDPLGESVHYYLSNGKVDFDKQNDEDLMMLSEKKEGWVNVYKERCYETREEAIRHIAPGTKYVDTIRVEWEE